MKTLLIAAAILILGGAAFYACAGEPPPVAGIKPESQSLINSVSISPYYTVGFADFNGRATSGGGFDVGLGLSKTISLVSFLETDDTNEGATFDRFGVGVQMSGKLGRWLKPYGRFSVAYAFDDSSGLAHDNLFLRPEFGASIDVYHYKKVSAAVTGAWCLDVDTDGHAAQRLKAGLSISF